MENIWMDATCPQSRNTSSANYSAILGRLNHMDDAINFAAIFSNGDGAIMNNTLHVNCLNVIDTLTGYSAAYPSGAIFMDSTVPFPTLALPLHIIFC